MFKHLKQFFIPCDSNGFFPYSLRNRALVAYVLIALVIKVGSWGFGALAPRSSFFASVSTQMVVYLTNQERVARGLLPLQENAALDAAAQAKAQDMARKGYFAHTSPDGVTPWYWFKANQYTYRYAGENLAVDFLESSDVVAAWMQSSSHRFNILNGNFRDIGVAITRGIIDNQETTIVVQMFGSPKVAARIPAPARTPAPTVMAQPSPRTSVSPVASPSVVAGAATQTPAVMGAVMAEPSPVIPSFALKEESGGIAVLTPHAIAALVDLAGNPRILYLVFLGFLAAVFTFGIFSRLYTPYPQAFAGMVVVMVFVVVMMTLPTADALLGFQVRVF